MSKSSSNTGEMSFLEHLEELRWHLVRSAAAVFILAILAFIFYRFIFDFIILAPKNPEFITNRLLCQLADFMNSPDLCINRVALQLQNVAFAGQFSATIMVSLYAGVVVAFPYIVWEFWRFIAPALYENERKHARGSLAAISILFFLGAFFGYFIIIPLSINFLGGWTVSKDVETVVDLASYLTITYIPLATGLIFQLPLLMIFLTKVGMITPKFMITYRRHAIVLLLILGPDSFIMPALILSVGIILFTKRYRTGEVKND